jgi:N-acetylglucosaminyl-diphospho-decaprenol L-rhamnosyltransferase
LSSHTPRWAAVVVSYEAGPRLIECVRSLLADTSEGGPPEIVVVDHGSTDGSVGEFQRALPTIGVLHPGGNLGYAGGANRGIAVTHAPIVAVCNADIEVEPGTAARLVARFDAEPDLGALGPTVRNPDGTPYHSARSVPSAVDAVGHALFGRLRPRNRFTRRYRQLDLDPTLARDADWVPARRSRVDRGMGRALLHVRRRR